MFPLFSAASRRAARHALVPRAASVACAVLAAVTLSACSPRYDWRTVNDDAGRYSVSFPGKPALDTRDVDIGGGAHWPMRMQTASVKDAVFAVGAVALPDTRATSRQAALDFVTQGIARNVGTPGTSREVRIQGTDGRPLPAREWRASGQIPGTRQQRAVIARFVATDTRVYEAVVIAEHAPPDAEVRQFLDSFRPF